MEGYNSCSNTDSCLLSFASQCHSIMLVFREHNSTFHFAAANTLRSVVYKCPQATNPDRQPSSNFCRQVKVERLKVVPCAVPTDCDRTLQAVLHTVAKKCGGEWNQSCVQASVNESESKSKYQCCSQRDIVDKWRIAGSNTVCFSTFFEKWHPSSDKCLAIQITTKMH